jgi:hypothetical protein
MASTPKAAEAMQELSHSAGNFDHIGVRGFILPGAPKLV